MNTITEVLANWHGLADILMNMQHARVGCLH